MTVARPVFVIGVSGASWKVINTLTADGKLPNIRRLCQEGASGVMSSVKVAGDKHFRPQTAWPTLASGVRPETHGVTAFYSDARDAVVPMIWDAYQQQGVRVGLFGWPVTWPPKQVDGFVIPSHLARNSETWPPELVFIKALDRHGKSAERGTSGFMEGTSGPSLLAIARSIVSTGGASAGLVRVGLKLSQALASHDIETRAIRLRHAKLELNADLFLSLVRRHGTRFSAFSTFLVDMISHRYWRYYEPQLFGEETAAKRVRRFQNAIAGAYEHVDRVVGRVTAFAPPDSIVVVVSEHGMSAEPISAEIGKWRYVIKGDKVLELIGLNSGIEICPIARWIAFRFKADSCTQMEIGSRLRTILIKETQLPLFQVHFHQDDEVIIKFNLHNTVERYVNFDLEKLTIIYNDQQRPFSYLTKPLGRQRSAMHDGEAVLIMKGPGITPGGNIRNASLVDFMPTVLHASGAPIPQGLDGTVLSVFQG